MAGEGCRYHSLVEKIKRLFLTRCDLLLWKAAGQGAPWGRLYRLLADRGAFISFFADVM
jgi:hypothetical protein